MRLMLVKLVMIISLIILMAGVVNVTGCAPILNTELTKTNVENVYHRLAINSGEQDIPPLVILTSGTINAWTDGETVVITTALLNQLHNQDEVALILGHELAHAINHDVLHYKDMDQRNVEAHADKLGAFIMMRAGFDICKGKRVFGIFKELFGDTAAPTSHPSNAYRSDQLNLPQCQS